MECRRRMDEEIRATVTTFDEYIYLQATPGRFDIELGPALFLFILLFSFSPRWPTHFIATLT